MTTFKMARSDTQARSRHILFTLVGITTCAVICRYAWQWRSPSVSPSLGFFPSVKKTRPIPSFKTRSELGKILERERFTRGVELGVQRGIFADTTLSSWTSAREYVLVDLWGHQKNYKDAANIADAHHESLKRQALQRMAKYSNRGTDVKVCQGLTLQCVLKFDDAYFDYIYVDARHDYKGVLEDLNAWWPKLRGGGIMAGHDYVTNDDGPKQSGQDWSVNYDGTKDRTGRACKGAVDDFAAEHGLQIVVSYREAGWNTWAVRKPENV